MSTFLEAVSLRKTYGQGEKTLEVLKGLNLTIPSGVLAAIVGPSGSGKSTLLHLLGGLDRPTSGKVLFSAKILGGSAPPRFVADGGEGERVNLYDLLDREQAAIRNRSFGFVFQFYHLVPELTALENVALPGWIANGSRDSRQVLKEAQALLTEVGLNERVSHRPSELSGGEQQRVSIARALMNNPRLVFCDEPTGNLDSQTGAAILDLLVERNRKQGTTFLIVTHEPAITKIAGAVFTLKDGRLWD